jgi:hypothetical protein
MNALRLSVVALLIAGVSCATEPPGPLSGNYHSEGHAVENGSFYASSATFSLVQHGNTITGTWPGGARFSGTLDDTLLTGELFSPGCTAGGLLSAIVHAAVDSINGKVYDSPCGGGTGYTTIHARRVN